MPNWPQALTLANYPCMLYTQKKPPLLVFVARERPPSTSKADGRAPLCIGPLAVDEMSRTDMARHALS